MSRKSVVLVVTLLTLALVAGASAPAMAATGTSSQHQHVNDDIREQTAQGTLNNSTMENMSKEELVDRMVNLQNVLAQTQDQYLKVYASLQAELNRQQGAETNMSVDFSATPDGSEAPLYNETELQAMSRSELTGLVLDYQTLIEETQSENLRIYRELQLELNDEQARTEAPEPTPTATPEPTQTATPESSPTLTDESTPSPTSAETTTSSPGFGVVIGVLSLVIGTILAFRRN